MGNHAIGIDLGTTFSALATVNTSGNPEIVPNSDGERVTASAVFFNETGQVLVGQLAVDAALGEPDRVVQHIKRHMGESEWSVKIGAHSYSAVDISAMILKKIKQDAEATMGSIEHAVITVPAYFDEFRRKATMDAAEKAGFNVLRIINEPTAAALAYAKTAECLGTVLIYDFGGGTFDVSIVKIASPQNITVLASDGDHELGGINFDELLADHLNDLFQKETGIDLKQEKDSTLFLRTLSESERAKRKLSKINQVYPIPINCRQEWMNARIDRSMFNKLTENLITRTEMLVEQTLSLANLETQDIDAVLLVGGSTRIPAVKNMLETKFNKKALTQVNPDEAVALGAAIQAAMLMQEKGLIQLEKSAAVALRNTRLQDVTNHSFGTLSINDYHGIEALRNTIIIPKNSSIPTSRTESFFTRHDGQDGVDIQITQGEDENPEFVNVIAEGRFDLPPNRPSGMEVTATYSYDANGRMSCEFLDVDSGRKKTINLDTESRSVVAGEDQIDFAAFEDLEIE